MIAHASPQECSRCDILACPCSCHKKAPATGEPAPLPHLSDEDES